MRKMTEAEIDELIAGSNWATICTVTPNGMPYAVEATYFIDGDKIGFMINPRGTTMQNLAHNSNLLLKITQSSKDLTSWEGVSLFGNGANVNDALEIRKGWDLLGKVMNCDYSEAAEKFSVSNKKSPYLCCSITRRTGRCSG